MMSEQVAFCGEIVDQIHSLKARVYYADTDFSGVVYHGRYLEFFERGRSEFLRMIGIHHTELAAGQSGEKLMWIVRRMELDFHKSAHIDNILTIKTMIVKISGARIIMDQRILCHDRLLVTAKVEAALINEHERPRRFPKEFAAKWQVSNSTAHQV